MTYAAVHESLNAVPVGWTLSPHAVLDNTTIQLQVALQYQNIDSLESNLASVSTPSNDDYGKYFGIDELDAFFAPSSDVESRLLSWLKTSAAAVVDSHAGVISFTTTVGNANKMLDTKFGIYNDGRVAKLRTTAYSIPNELVDAIDIISPTTYFGRTHAQGFIPKALASGPATASVKKRQDVVSSCEITVPVRRGGNVTQNFTLITPTCLKELYNVHYKADPRSGSTIAFGSFLNQSANYQDLAKFEQFFDLPSQNFTVAIINGGVDDQNQTTAQNTEANLDVQNIVGLVDGLPVSEYITGGLPPFIPDLLSPNASSNQNEPYLQYYQYLLSQSDSELPWVISNSYSDHEDTVPPRYARRVCNMIGMLGLRGRTILASSGDEGTGAVCRAPSGAKQFTAHFPGTCPYVTAVGGTQYYNPEQAWNDSSGGFSDYYPTAWYQKDAIDTFLSEHINNATKSHYEPFVTFGGRGFPDIAAHSLSPSYLTIIDSDIEPNGGTSAACPVVAAVIALLNDARFRAGQPAMGFINPWLYSNAAALNDITLGGSIGCTGTDLQTGLPVAGAGIIPYASWNATVGWDPATGLGTPNFGKMRDLAVGVPG